MKFEIVKTSRGCIDTSFERHRIKEAFDDRPDIAEKLNKLMDLVEACKWEEADRELHTPFWKGYDTQAGCPTAEFIGLCFDVGEQPRGFNNFFSYIDLIELMVEPDTELKVTPHKKRKALDKSKPVC